MQLEGTLGFLGFGNMGIAIAKGLVSTGVISGQRVAVFDIDESKQVSATELGAAVAGSAGELAQMSDILLLAVKPQSMAEALEQIKPTLKTHTLIVSIAAGISIGYIQERLGTSVRVVRVMPNTPALVKAGAAGIALSASCSEKDGNTARTIFESIGIAEMVAEEQIDTVTALSGSGPAYFFYMVECLVEAAAAHGLDRDQAARLAGQTMLGAGRLLAESGEPASVLRERVTSKGGTTAAALEAFRAGGFDGLVRAAVDAAAKRAKELGK